MAKKAIRVLVVQFPDREHFMLRYTDPVTKKRIHRSADTGDRKEAERAAQRWEDELRSGRFKPSDELTWQEFRDRFEDEHVKFLSDGYFYSFQASFSKFEKLTGIQNLADVPSVLDEFDLKLRRSKLSPNTVRSYVKHLKVSLAWAHDKGLLDRVKMKLPEAPEDVMKGRALTDAEFDLIVEQATAANVGVNSVTSWQRFLKGLWLSGLRRSEALRLSWDTNSPFSIDLSGLHPRFKIRSSGQKSRRSQFCAMAPDFAEWILKSTPAAERTGHVFQPLGKSGVECQHRKQASA